MAMCLVGYFEDCAFNPEREKKLQTEEQHKQTCFKRFALAAIKKGTVKRPGWRQTNQEAPATVQNLLGVVEMEELRLIQIWNTRSRQSLQDLANGLNKHRDQFASSWTKQLTPTI